MKYNDPFIQEFESWDSVCSSFCLHFFLCRRWWHENQAGYRTDTDTDTDADTK